jgi:hypothetical protein
MMDSALLMSRDRVMATFRRYAADDALCCPSRRTTVTYAIKRSPGGSSLTVESMSTEAVSKP